VAESAAVFSRQSALGAQVPLKCALRLFKKASMPSKSRACERLRKSRGSRVHVGFESVVGAGQQQIFRAPDRPRPAPSRDARRSVDLAGQIPVFQRGVDEAPFGRFVGAQYPRRVEQLLRAP